MNIDQGTSTKYKIPNSKDCINYFTKLTSITCFSRLPCFSRLSFPLHSLLISFSLVSKSPRYPGAVVFQKELLTSDSQSLLLFYSDLPLLIATEREVHRWQDETDGQCQMNSNHRREKQILRICDAISIIHIQRTEIQYKSDPHPSNHSNHLAKVTAQLKGIVSGTIEPTFNHFEGSP